MTDGVKNYNQMQQEFLSEFRKDCRIALVDLEHKRKLFALLFKALFGLSGVLAIICILIAIYKTQTAEPIVAWSMFFILVLFFSKIASKKISTDVKTIIMPKLCNAIKNIKWAPNASVNHGLYKLAGIITQDYKKVNVDDTFAGVYEGANYKIVEAEYIDIDYKEVDGKREKEETTIFKGLLITLDMNKKFDSHTIIAPNGLFHISGVKGLKHTTLEDVVFEKNNDVYTNNEVEARYLITPAFMERFNNIKMSFKADSIRCAFYENKLIIGLETSKDMFEPCSLWKPLHDEKQYFEMFEEILSIIKLIDHFKLNEKTGV